MACTSAVLAGLAQDCSQSMGGVNKVLIRPYSAGTIYFASSADTKVKVDGLTGLTGQTIEWKAYFFRKNNAQVTSTLNADPSNGVNYVSSELQLTFTKQETVKRVEMSALVLGEVMVVYQDSNGIWWALGVNSPVVATAGTAQTGAARTDGNNYQITLTSEDLTWPVELDENSSAAASGVPFPA